MIVNKITSGYVIQQYDTEKKQFIYQEFVAANSCDYENLNGEAVDVEEVGMANSDGSVPYFPYEMVQPSLDTTTQSDRILTT
jgi:hypothetical protein